MEKATICIIDHLNVPDMKQANGLLLWTACLFGCNTVSSSWWASTLLIPLRFPLMSPSNKMEFYIHFLQAQQRRGSNPVLDETIQTLPKMHDFLQANKKVKGKSQHQIVLLKKIEKQIEEGYTACKDWYIKLLDQHKLLPLLAFISNDEPGDEKPIQVWYLPDNDSLENGKRIVNMFTDVIKAHDILLMLDAAVVRQYATLHEIARLPLASTSGMVLCDPLFQFPEPLNLTSNQVYVLRNELSAAAWPLMNELAGLASEFEKISFEENNFSQLAALYSEKAGLLKSKVQEAINTNEYFNQIKTETTTRYRLWAGMSSLNNLFDLYAHQGIIDPSAKAYAKEGAAQKVNLDNSRLFLFLEKIEN